MRFTITYTFRRQKPVGTHLGEFTEYVCTYVRTHIRTVVRVKQTPRATRGLRYRVESPSYIPHKL